jgi:membrane protease YdiL (CAAX protease family)
MLERISRQNAGLALLLLVPAQTIGTLMSHVIAPGTVGQTVLFLTKIWMLVLPLVWLVGVDKNTVQIPLPKRRDLMAGVVLGSLMFVVILAAYWFLGRQWINPSEVRSQAQRIGVLTPTIYLAGVVFWTLINSLLEEYVWRWFVFRKCEMIVSGIAAVLLSALFFTLHHILELAVNVGDWRVVVLGSLAVFSAGAIWSGCYWVYRSIWTCYVSHVLADLAIAIVGWQILFT